MAYRWPETGQVVPPAPPPSGENVARNAAAWRASSVFNTLSGGDKAFDGVVAEGSKWTSNGVDAQSWLALDLGENHDISGFVVRHAGAGGEPASFNTAAYRLESGETLSGPWGVLATVDNGAQSDVVTTLLSAQSTTRYVRLLVTDAGIDNHARIPELEVYGVRSRPPPDPNPEPPPGENVARNSVNWSASSTFNAASGGDRAYDGVVSEASKWTSDGVGAESWLALDLGATYDIGAFAVQHAGAAGEPSYFNTAAFRFEVGGSLAGPWTSVATVDNAVNDDSSAVVLLDAATARYVRLYVIDAGIDNHARIPEFEIYGTPRPETLNRIANGDFDQGTSAWSRWTERGGFDPIVANGSLQLVSANHNGGLYQQFATGGAGTKLAVEGFWTSEPTASNTQWAEILVINGPRLPVDGADITGGDSDVVLIYKNDTWVSPQGWSGSMADTSPVTSSAAVFTATGDVATIVLKSGNVGTVTTGTRFDDITVMARGATPGENLPPTAVMSATPSVGQAPLTVGFDAAGSTDPDGDVLSYEWVLGDGAIASEAVLSHVYQSSGTYVVALTVDDGRGASGQTSTVITVGNATVEMPDFCPSALNFPTIRNQLSHQGQELVSTKIGFHVAPAGNQRGLGDWMQCLDAAGIPFFLKSVDSAGQVFEAVQLKAASGVPHVLVYRKSGVTSSDAEQNWDPGVPEYHLPPLEAAQNHWRRHRDAFPPELEEYKHLIWIETVNEIDKNRSEWLAEFSYHTALMAMEEGFNWAAFGWSSGEPEREHWEGPQMQRFLALAGEHPDRVAVALHEYSYVTDSVDRDFPFLVGRFQMLFDVADSFGIPRPTVLVTEFGWTYQDVAPIGQAMEIDLPWADRLYSEHPQVKGAAIWYLGPGFGGIANQAQRLIAPLTEYSLQNYFVIPSQ